MTDAQKVIIVLREIRKIQREAAKLLSEDLSDGVAKGMLEATGRILEALEKGGQDVTVLGYREKTVG